MLNVTDINVYYGAIHALKGLSFHVEEGEIVSLIGANGAGKTTTMQTISGLLRSKTGDITFMESSIFKTEPHKIVALGLAQVPEGRRIFGSLTVQENLEMGAYIRSGKESTAIAEDLEKVFVRFPRLKERRKQVAGTLSGGEQQMLAIGRALMSRPKMLRWTSRPWAWPPSWCRKFSTASPRSIKKAPPCCWWSKTPKWRCPFPTAPMCWKRRHLSGRRRRRAAGQRTGQAGLPRRISLRKPTKTRFPFRKRVLP